MAAFMLIIWPLVTAAIFAAFGPLRGLIWATMAGHLFLPSGYSFVLPFIPDFDKNSSISLSLILAAVFFRRRLPPAPPRETNTGLQRTMIAFAALLVVGAVVTTLTNREPIVVGEGQFPGLRPWDVISMVHQPFIVLVPFFLALKWLDRPELHHEVLKAMTLLGVLYGILVLFEWRMSPQLNNWVYGYFSHSWIQHVRGGGQFRAIVFLSHGLAVGLFLFSALMAALGSAVSSRDGKARMLYLVASGWLALALLLSLNFGAVFIAVLLGGGLILFGRYLSLWMAAGAAAMFLILPALRQSGILTFDTVIALAERIDPNRARSFDFRLDQENALLAHALQKPIFGWGGWGRARGVGGEGDGRTVVDGLWIIQLGETGWLGYICYFGLLALPIIALPLLHRRRGIAMATVALAAIGAGNFLYAIPNAFLSPIGLLVYGAIAGFVLHRYHAGETAMPEASHRAPVGYTRFSTESAATATSRNLSRQQLARELDSSLRRRE